MPLYDYQCRTCGHSFETLESVRHNGSRKCNVCGDKAERIMSPSSIRFKGSGFHCTDYGRHGRRKQNLI